MSQSIRIAVLHFQHETVTFLRNDTTTDDFVYPGSPARGEALLASGPKSNRGVSGDHGRAEKPLLRQGFIHYFRVSDGHGRFREFPGARRG